MTPRAIHLGPSVTLPLSIVTESVGILARKRAGKSYTARRLVEQLFAAGEQLVIVDPKGDWWGIRAAADGKGAGLPILTLGGEHGNFPLGPGTDAGEQAAQLVVEHRVSVLLDLSAFRKREVAAFMTGFLETLYRLKARDQYRTPLMLVIDEADAIAPQQPMAGEERMLGAAEDIVRRGGQRGIGVMLITQRAAVLNKNVLTQVSVLILLRTTGSQDLDALELWIKRHGQPEEKNQVMSSLASLPTGDAWVWAPGWPDERGIFARTHVSPIATFDSGATPAPGRAAAAPRVLAEADLEAFGTAMASATEKAKADDPNELRKRIVQLERELARKVVPPPRQLITREDLAMITEREEELAALADQLLTNARAGRAHLKFLNSLIPSETRPAPERATEKDRPTPGPTPDRSAPAPRAARARSGKRNASERILDALSELEAIGVDTPIRSQVALLAGYTHVRSKGLLNALGELRGRGSIDYPMPACVQLTDKGRAEALQADAPRSNEEVQQRVIALLGGATGRLLEALVEHYPRPIDREALARATGYGHLRSKGYMNALGRLRGLGLIDYPASGQVVALDTLFPLGAGR